MTLNRFQNNHTQRNIKLVIQYDGTNYSGWQIQRAKKTIQGEIVKAIKKVTGEKVNLTGASRTDAGVHALRQVGNFKTVSKVTCKKFPHAINFFLKPDIAVLEASDVPLDFHAQFDAKRKKYRYVILNSYPRMPVWRYYSCHVRPVLNIDLMKKAADFFIGTKDFRAFGSEGDRKKNTVRTIYSISLEKKDNLINIEVEGNGFLYNMVRCIVGTLIRVGKGALEPQQVKGIIEERSRIEAGPVSLAKGLFLVEVYY